VSIRAADPWPIPLYVAVVSRRDVVYRGILAVLAERPDRYVVTAMPSVRALGPRVDVVVYDLELSGEVEAELRVLVERTEGRVLALANRADSALGRRAVDLGAAGFVALDVAAETLSEVVVQVAAGKEVGSPAGAVSPLSKREHEILVLACEGLTNTEIAASLFLSANTLKSHLRSAYHKLGVHNRTQAVVWYIRNGLGGDS
jgi:DNA-binding NarL/FixJ family response regulator